MPTTAIPNKLALDIFKYIKTHNNAIRIHFALNCLHPVQVKSQTP